jgi:nicotinic acid mononucleotide adenylyltransferase
LRAFGVVTRRCGGFPRIELLALLEATHKDIAFTVVVGQDLVASLPTWAFADTLRQSARLLVLPRPGESAPVSAVEVLAHPDAGAAVQSTAASSTEVRRRLAHHQRCDGMLPVRVRAQRELFLS